MRTGVTDLDNPYPLRERLPAVYLDDDFTVRFTLGFDEVLAPLFATLDCLPAYLDPRLAPDDFVNWLAGWVAFPVDESWTLAQRRELVAWAVELHRWRGTRRGLVTHVELLTGGVVQVVDSGGCTWSEESGGTLPGSAPPQITVLVQVSDPATVDRRRLHEAIVELVPAHVPVSVEVTAAPAPSPKSPEE